MERGVHIEQLLRWRLELAEREAPTRPRAADLIAADRPWWERWPERFSTRVARLTAMPLAYGYAMASGEQANGHPVPVLIVGHEDVEDYARVLYLSVRAGRLRLRFSLSDGAATQDESWNATILSAESGAPVASAIAEKGQTGEYRLDAELPPTLGDAWSAFKVTDRMPFRLILESASRFRSA